MKSKKILALLLALVMMLSLLAGCGAKESTTGDEVKEQPESGKSEGQKTEESKETVSTESSEGPTPLSVMLIMGNASYSYEENVAWNYLEELGNFEFELYEFPASEATEKMNLMMAGGEYTDILFKAGYIDLNQYGMDGLLIPLEDLIREYAPNLTAILDERNAWSSLEAPDGHIYSLPYIDKGVSFDGNGCYWINRNWMEAVGHDMPTNQEELYELLKAFATEDPNGNGIADEIPLAVHAGDHTHSLANLISYFGDGLWYSDYWMVMDGQMEYLPTTEYFKENVLEYLHKLYEEGLLNEDAFTLTWDQRKAACGAEDMAYGCYFDSSPSGLPEDEMMLDWVALKPFDTDNFALTNGIVNGGLSISDKCECPERVMEWIDFMYTEEGGRVMRHGVENVTYVIHEDGTYEQLEDAFESNVFQGTLMGAATVPGLLPDLYYLGASDPATKHVNEESVFGAFSEGVICTAPKYTVEEYDEYSVLFTDIDAYVRNYIAEAVTGIVSIEDTWEDFQSTLEEMGVDRMIEIQRSAYDRVK